MKLMVTGATGFLGGRIAQQLRARGDDVVALVRNPEKAQSLRYLGCTLVQGEVTDAAAVHRAIESVDGIFHIAGRYEVGIDPRECPSMMATNVEGTRTVLDAGMQAGVSRIVHASSIIYFGNTHGRVIDETYVPDPADGFLSCYHRSKVEAHHVMTQKVCDGAPIVTLCPGTIYGPGDHSEIGRQLLQAANGKLPALILVDVGLTMVHVDDVADGFIRAFDNGTIGESYLLGGETLRMREVLSMAGRIGGHPLTKRSLPTPLVKAIAPIAPAVLPKFGYPPNLRELIRSADNVTYWAKDTKARSELGWTTRSLEVGLQDLISAQ